MSDQDFYSCMVDLDQWDLVLGSGDADAIWFTSH